MQLLCTVADYSRTKNQTYLHFSTRRRVIVKGQIVYNGNMLFQHMHLVSLSQSGEKVILNVSVRMVRSLRDESVRKRSMKSIE